MGNNAVAGPQVRDFASHLGDYAGRLMTQDVRQFRNVSESLEDMKIRAADATTAGLYQDFIRTDLRDGDIFNPKWLAHLMHYRSLHSEPPARKSVSPN